MGIREIVKKVVVGGVLLLMAGCASAPEVKQRYFWPPLPDEPKVEWVGAYRSQLDMPRTAFEKFMENLVGAPEALRLNRPVGIVSDGGDRVYISDSILSNVVVFDFKKREVTYLGIMKPDEMVPFRHPSGLALDREKNLYVCDTAEKRIYVFSPAEKLLRSIDISKQTRQPLGLTIDHERNRILVGDSRAQQLFVYGLDGNYLFSVGLAGGGDVDGSFNMPAMMAITKNGNIVVADSMNARVQIFDLDGKFIRKFGKRGDNPGEFQLIKGVAVDSENHIYVTDAKGNNVGIYSETGDYLLTLGAAYSAERIVAPGGFILPQGIFIDESDKIYVVDQLNGRFQVFQFMNKEYLKEHPVEAAGQPPAGGK